MKRWLVYALGGGLGHLTRALALGRAAAQRGYHLTILCNSPMAASLLSDDCPKRIALPASLELILLDPQAGRDDTAENVLRILARRDFDLLVVDTFARGLGGELVATLPTIPQPKVWIHRNVSPRYVDQCDLLTFARHFNLVLVPGEDAPLAHLPRAFRTSPWTVCDFGDLLNRSDARQAFGIPVHDFLPMAVVVGTGRPDEVEAARLAAATLYRRLAGRVHVRLATTRSTGESFAVSVWPLMVLMRGIDLLVGAGGYNTVYEARQTGTPLIAVPQQRQYDVQSQRLSVEESSPTWSAAVERVTRWNFSKQRASKRFENGTHAAVLQTASLLDDWALF